MVVPSTAVENTPHYQEAEDRIPTGAGVFRLSLSTSLDHFISCVINLVSQGGCSGLK